MLWRVVFERDGAEYAVTASGATSQLAVEDVVARFETPAMRRRGEYIQILSVRECADGDCDNRSDDWDGWEEVDDGPDHHGPEYIPVFRTMRSSKKETHEDQGS